MPKCTKGYNVEVLQDCAGFYIGTIEKDEGIPNCRISGYFINREYAKEALKKRAFIIRNATENDWCNGGKGCLEVLGIA